MKRKHILPLLLVVLLLSGCATLQDKWDKATEDERARLVVSQFQGTLTNMFILADAFVKANPQYQKE